MAVVPSCEPASVEANPAAVASEEQPTVNPGSALASLWILTSQDHNPPASIPATVPGAAICPKCGMHFNASLYSPIHHACLGCGWSDLADPESGSSKNAGETNISYE